MSQQATPWYTRAIDLAGATAMLLWFGLLLAAAVWACLGEQIAEEFRRWQERTAELAQLRRMWQNGR